MDAARRIFLAIAVFVVVLGGAASADVVATGTIVNHMVFTPAVEGGARARVDGTETITWDSVAYPILDGARTIDLGTDLGSSTTTVLIVYSTIPAPFQRTVTTGSAFTFTSPDGEDTGTVNDTWIAVNPVSDSSGSLTGTLVGAGSTQLPPVSPSLAYSLDSTMTNCVLNGLFIADCTGFVALNVFESIHTPTGTAVSVSDDVQFHNPLIKQTVALDFELTFDSVSNAGETLVAPAATSQSSVPGNIVVNDEGYTAVYFDASTTATVSGDIQICASYEDDDDDGLIDGTAFDECTVRLLHSEAGVFADRTLQSSDTACPFTPQQATCGLAGDLGGAPCIDTLNKQVCASTTSLSPFVIGISTSANVPVFGVWGFGALASALLFGGIAKARNRSRWGER